jgi:predicted protein tyrosine phosphatase
MFEIRICGFSELQDCIRQFNPTHVISVIRSIEPIEGKHLVIPCDDIPMPIEGMQEPTSEHLAAAMAFTEHLNENDRVIVHCFAGQSRSTAIAIAILIQHGLTSKQAFDHVSRLRSILLPNTRIIEYTDAYFNLGGELIQLVEDHRRGVYQRTLFPEAGVSRESIDIMKELLEKLNTTNSTSF